MGATIDGFLKSPFAGIAPWALMAILSTPGRFEIAVLSALGFALLVMVVGALRGIKIHGLEIFGATVFATLALVGALGGDNVTTFLETWAGELTNLSLAVFAWFTLLIRRPFTLSYAKDSTPQEHWDSPLFKRINSVITAAWASAFTFAAAVGFVGDAVLHDPGNFWTGWILQLAAIFCAVSFTEFYADYATAKFALANGEQAEVPSPVNILEWLPEFVVVAGVAGLITGAVDFLVGVGLIVAGSVAASAMAKFAK
ncbi:hypothetical protein BST27_00515 [Mycobacterium intermedium]|uniref:Uncharacterized protein n=1 Tax=Mycobacterium intermedium TaxID=28445 RepID=A0A1E3SAV1_MYCIE|nr:hypothetical protein BHQ20_18530 [Mycobacterium intermedium]OPE51391.1 hypothetical protein BV508_06775 [Mycobacterium intermedium]ORB10686.1 hypothetical protein BST27_00515 [Mycobacterium intermedium]